MMRGFSRDSLIVTGMKPCVPVRSTGWEDQRVR